MIYLQLAVITFVLTLVSQPHPCLNSANKLFLYPAAEIRNGGQLRAGWQWNVIIVCTFFLRPIIVCVDDLRDYIQVFGFFPNHFHF